LPNFSIDIASRNRVVYDASAYLGKLSDESVPTIPIVKSHAVENPTGNDRLR
jgi:hypothetical protein